MVEVLLQDTHGQETINWSDVLFMKMRPINRVTSGPFWGYDCHIWCLCQQYIGCFWVVADDSSGVGGHFMDLVAEHSTRQSSLAT